MFCGMGGVLSVFYFILFYFLYLMCPNKGGIPEQSPREGQLDNPTSVLVWGPRGMASPICGLLIQTLRGLP